MWQENCHFYSGLSFQEEHFGFRIYNCLYDFPLREKPDETDIQAQRRTDLNVENFMSLDFGAFLELSLTSVLKSKPRDISIYV
jgi:hypothetical protein